MFQPPLRCPRVCAPIAAAAALLLPGCCYFYLVLLFVVGMGHGGDRNFPGGKKSGPKPKMDEASVVKRMKREASKERTALRKAAAAAAAVDMEQAERRRALLRVKHGDQPMCVRRQLGSQRIADKVATAAAAPAAAAAAPAAAAQPHKGSLESFLSKPSAPEV